MVAVLCDDGTAIVGRGRRRRSRDQAVSPAPQGIRRHRGIRTSREPEIDGRAPHDHDRCHTATHGARPRQPTTTRSRVVDPPGWRLLARTVPWVNPLSVTHSAERPAMDFPPRGEVHPRISAARSSLDLCDRRAVKGRLKPPSLAETDPTHRVGARQPIAVGHIEVDIPKISNM
jgi:hypothetical protein